ncbi:MAG: TonB-dependent receptor plug domain-containing protein [Ginsengibacter sp.]
MFKSTVPTQILSGPILQQLSTNSIADAARYFSGVLIKDYGGVGGLKTISVRSLGASNTGIVYDGLPVSNMQTGQIDLSQYSSSFVESIQLYNANPPGVLLPARARAAAAILAITTNTFQPRLSSKKWEAGIKAGSFSLWQPFVNMYFPVGKSAALSAVFESVNSKGDYPFFINNGDLSEKTRRTNSEVHSNRLELNYVNILKDSSTLQTKVGGFTSNRGLPGAIIFFNSRSVQNLFNDEFFIQSRYKKIIDKRTSLLASAKYNYSFLRYVDPDFLNNVGGINDKYKQQETYASIALARNVHNYLSLSVAADFSYSSLLSDRNDFVKPNRLSLWNAIAADYHDKHFQINGSLLYTHIYDRVSDSISSINRDKITPTIALSYKANAESPFIFRIFYKNILRIPTFNDMYYTLIGNKKVRPEYSTQYNAGITWSKTLSTQIINRTNFSVDAYYNLIKDKIVAFPSQNLFGWTILNLGTVDIKGIDINAESAGKLSPVWNWFLRMTYTYQHAIDVTNPASDSYKNKIPYTPDHTGSLLANFSKERWSMGYSLLFSSVRYTLGQNNYFNQLPGWTTQDIFISHDLNTVYFKTTIKASLNNLTNEQIDVVRNFPMPGRSFTITLLFNNL